MSICETCPAAEVDIMISVLLNLFDTRASLISLLKLMIDREIAHAGATPSECGRVGILYSSLTFQRTTRHSLEVIRHARSFCLHLLEFTATIT